MDAAKFIMTMRRICQNSYCNDCVIGSFCGKTWDGWTEIDTEEAVEIVEKWVEGHPVKTRQTEFLKKFPNTAVSHGTIDILPCWLDKTLAEDCDDGYPRECVECRKEFWNKVIE